MLRRSAAGGFTTSKPAARRDRLPVARFPGGLDFFACSPSTVPTRSSCPVAASSCSSSSPISCLLGRSNLHTAEWCAALTPPRAGPCVQAVGSAGTLCTHRNECHFSTFFVGVAAACSPGVIAELVPIHQHLSEQDATKGNPANARSHAVTLVDVAANDEVGCMRLRGARRSWVKALRAAALVAGACGPQRGVAGRTWCRRSSSSTARELYGQGPSSRVRAMNLS